MWLLLTTLHHRRFVEDIANILALPAGAILQMRYASKYCGIPFSDNQIFASDEISQNPETLGYSADALIALGYPSKKNDCIAPLRLCKILSFSKSGSLIIFEVELGEFTSLPNALNDIRDNLSTLDYNNLPSGFSPNVSSGSPGLFVQQLANKPNCLIPHRNAIDGWEKAATVVFEAINSFNSTCLTEDRKISISFLHHLEIRPNALRTGQILNNSIVIESGLHADMTLHCLTDIYNKSPITAPLGEVILELSNPAVSFNTSKRLRVDSRRDSKRIKLSGSANFRGIHGHISLMSVHFYYKEEELKASQEMADALQFKGKADRTEVVFARADIPLTVGRYVPAGAALTTATAVMMAGITGRSKDGLDDAIPNSLLGPLIFLITLLGLILGFRRTN